MLPDEPDTEPEMVRVLYGGPAGELGADGYFCLSGREALWPRATADRVRQLGHNLAIVYDEPDGMIAMSDAGANGAEALTVLADAATLATVGDSGPEMITPGEALQPPEE